MTNSETPPAKRPTVLVVDDEPANILFVRSCLQAEFRVVAFENPAEVLRDFRPGDIDLMVSDVRMPQLGGVELLEAVRQRDPDLAAVLLTSFGTVQQAVDAIKRGAYDYLAWPFDEEQLRMVVRRAVEHTRLARRARTLEAELGQRDSFGSIVGQSAAMQTIFTLLDRVRTSDIAVLITGESGTGKELIARVLHRSSRRAAGPFVAANCGAIPRELLETQLFGHARGAIGSAVAEKRGVLEEAAGGTLLLDEIGDLPQDLQVKLNRFLQEGVLRRVGDPEERQVDVRLIAATNRDLEQEVALGRFRDDLFYRLNSYPIHLPPLRERGDDIPLLAQHFLREKAAREGKKLEGFDAEALGALVRYRWPGNVRELEGIIARAVLLCTGSHITLACLPEAIRNPGRVSVSLSSFAGRTYREVQQTAADEIARAYLNDLMLRHRGNVSKAAVEAGVERETLHRFLKKHGVRPSHYRTSREE